MSEANEDDAFVLSDSQIKSVQARLREIVGAEIYDRVFFGAAFVEIDDRAFLVYAGNEELAEEISDKFSHYLVSVATQITGMPVDFAFVMPIQYR